MEGRRPGQPCTARNPTTSHQILRRADARGGWTSSRHLGEGADVGAVAALLGKGADEPISFGEFEEVMRDVRGEDVEIWDVRGDLP